MKTINKLSRLFTLTISCLLILGLVACTNLFGTKIEKAYIKISATTPNMRTVLPSAFTENTTGLTWTLSGTKDNTSVTFEKTWSDTNDKTAYKNMTSDTFLIPETGSWTFTLIAQIDGKDVLYSEISQEIKAGPNTLSFAMAEATSDNLADGEISFKLSFPSNVISKAEAYLYKYNGTDFEPTEITSQSNSITGNTANITYKNIAAGYYRLKLELFQNINNQNEKIQTYSTLVRVAPGLCSSSSYQIENLAQLFTVTYSPNGGTMPNNFTSETHNGYTSFELPTPTKEGYEFTGWYTDADCSTPVTLDNNGKYTLASDITLYAGWYAPYGSRYNPIENWKDLCDYVLYTETIYISGNMTANDNPISVSRPLTIIPVGNTTITRTTDRYLFEMSDNLSIQGSEENVLTIDGSQNITNAQPIFYCNYNDVQIDLQYCTIKNANCGSNDYGSVLYMEGSSEAYISNCTIQDNIGVPFVLYNTGTSQISNCTFTRNTATNDYIYSAAVYIDNTDLDITLENCAFTNNIFIEPDGDGLYYSDLGIENANSVTVKNCTFNDNNENYFNLYTLNCPSLTLDGNNKIPQLYYYNTASQSNLGIKLGTSFSSSDTIKITVRSCDDTESDLDLFDLEENQTVPEVFVLSNPDYSINPSTGLVESNIISLTQQVLESYSSTNNDRYSLPAGEYCVAENLILSYPIQISAAGSEVKLYSNEDCTISCSSNFSTSLASTIIQLPMSSGKLSLGGGAGTLTINGEGQDLSYIVISQSDLELNNNCSIQNGTVQDGALYISAGTFTMNGGTIENNTTTKTCSGIYNYGGTINIVGGTIQNNYSNNTNNGASIYHNGGTLTVLGTTITTGTHYTKNIVNGLEEEVSNAIAIASWEELETQINAVQDYAEFLITTDLVATSKINISKPVKITSNKNVTITRGESFTDLFLYNTSGLEIIGSSNAKITFNGNNIDANYPIIQANNDLILSYCDFLNNINIATYVDGGAIYIYSTSVNNVNISNCNFTNNSVTGSTMAGGAIAINSTKATSNFINCTFKSNKASNQGGGAIYISGNTQNCSEKWNTFTDCTFQDNSSYYSSYNYGGAIYVSSGPISLNNVTMNNNRYYSGETATSGIDSDIYINGYQQELKLDGNIQISNLQIKISSSSQKDIGISHNLSEDSQILELILTTGSTGSISNITQPFKIYTYDTVGTNVGSEEESELTTEQINCFKSIMDPNGNTYSLSPNGTLSAI